MKIFYDSQFKKFKVAPRVEKTEIFADWTYFASCIIRKHFKQCFLTAQSTLNFTSTSLYF